MQIGNENWVNSGKTFAKQKQPRANLRHYVGAGVETISQESTYLIFFRLGSAQPEHIKFYYVLGDDIVHLFTGRAWRRGFDSLPRHTNFV